LLIVATPVEFESSSRNGLGFKGFILGNMQGLIARNGGPYWRTMQLLNANLWLHLLYSMSENFGMNVMRGFFITSNPYHL
jgi:hypothetical protein